MEVEVKHDKKDSDICLYTSLTGFVFLFIFPLISIPLFLFSGSYSFYILRNRTYQSKAKVMTGLLISIISLTSIIIAYALIAYFGFQIISELF